MWPISAIPLSIRPIVLPISAAPLSVRPIVLPISAVPLSVRPIVLPISAVPLSIRPIVLPISAVPLSVRPISAVLFYFWPICKGGMTLWAVYHNRPCCVALSVLSLQTHTPKSPPPRHHRRLLPRERHMARPRRPATGVHRRAQRVHHSRARQGEPSPSASEECVRQNAHQTTC